MIKDVVGMTSTTIRQKVVGSGYCECCGYEGKIYQYSVLMRPIKTVYTIMGIFCSYDCMEKVSMFVD